jgi:hypothetical protein
VLAQDTGLDAQLSDGIGLLAFADPEEAAEGIERVRRDYAQHAAGGRRIAEEHLDAKKVLARLLRQLGMTK